MTRHLDVDAGLALAHLPPEHRLRKVLAAAIARANVGRPDGRCTDDTIPWRADYFGLDRCGAFSELSEEQQRALLDSASTALLHEAYFIEKLGLAFGAKMLLMSTTTEERMLYALFCADDSSPP